MYKKATLLTINYQREKVTAVTKREGDGSGKERRGRLSVELNRRLIETTAPRGWGGFAAPKQAC